jgi:hypothetical protein
MTATTPPPGAGSAPPRKPSTGPRTAAGKARSSMNALKTGIYSQSLIIRGEDPAQLATLAEEYFQRYLPAVPEERDQVDVMVRAVWTLRRLGAAEAQVWTHTMNNTYKLSADAPLGHAFLNCDRTLDRLQRFVNSTQRNLRDALHELERLRSLPADPDPTPGEATATAPSEPAACPPPPPQPAETEPVTPADQFVPSTSAEPTPGTPLWHKPGANCPFDDPKFDDSLKRCPICSPVTHPRRV